MNFEDFQDKLQTLLGKKDRLTCAEINYAACGRTDYDRSAKDRADTDFNVYEDEFLQKMQLVFHKISGLESANKDAKDRLKQMRKILSMADDEM